MMNDYWDNIVELLNIVPNEYNQLLHNLSNGDMPVFQNNYIYYFYFDKCSPLLHYEYYKYPSTEFKVKINEERSENYKSEKEYTKTVSGFYNATNSYKPTLFTQLKELLFKHMYSPLNRSLYIERDKLIF